MPGILRMQVAILGWDLKGPSSLLMSFQCNTDKQVVQCAPKQSRGGRPGLSQALPLLQALPYVALLIAMLFFIYAVIGMQVSSNSLGVPCAG